MPSNNRKRSSDSKENRKKKQGKKEDTRQEILNKAILTSLGLLHICNGGNNSVEKLPFDQWLRPWNVPKVKKKDGKIVPLRKKYDDVKQRIFDAIERMKEILDNDVIIFVNDSPTSQSSHLPQTVWNSLSEYSKWPGSPDRVSQELPVHRVMTVSVHVKGVGAYIALKPPSNRSSSKSSGITRSIHMLPDIIAKGSVFRAFLLNDNGGDINAAIATPRKYSCEARGIGMNGIPRLFSDLYNCCYAPILGFTPKIFDPTKPSSGISAEHLVNVVCRAARFIDKPHTTILGEETTDNDLKKMDNQGFALVGVMLAELDIARIVHVGLKAILGPDTIGSMHSMAYDIIGSLISNKERGGEAWYSEIALSLDSLTREDNWNVKSKLKTEAMKWVQTVLHHGVFRMAKGLSESIRSERRDKIQNRQSSYSHYVPHERLEDIFTPLEEFNERFVANRAMEFTEQFGGGVDNVVGFLFRGVPFNRLLNTIEKLESELLKSKATLVGHPDSPLAKHSTAKPRSDGLRIPISAFPCNRGSILIMRADQEAEVRAWLLFLHERHNGRRNSSLVTKVPIVTSMIVRGLIYPEESNDWEFIIAVRLLGCWFESNDHSRLQRNMGELKAEYAGDYRRILLLILKIFNSPQAIDAQWKSFVDQVSKFAAEKKGKLRLYGIWVPLFECLRVVIFGNSIKELVCGSFVILVRWIISGASKTFLEKNEAFVRHILNHALKEAKNAGGFGKLAEKPKVTLPVSFEFQELYMKFLGSLEVPEMLRAYLLLNTQLAACHIEQKRRGERLKPIIMDVYRSQHAGVWTESPKWFVELEDCRKYGNRGKRTIKVISDDSDCNGELDNEDNAREDSDSNTSEKNPFILFDSNRLSRISPVINDQVGVKSKRGIDRYFVCSNEEAQKVSMVPKNTKSLRDQVCFRPKPHPEEKKKRENVKKIKKQAKPGSIAKQNSHGKKKRSEIINNMRLSNKLTKERMEKEIGGFFECSSSSDEEDSDCVFDSDGLPSDISSESESEEQHFSNVEYKEDSNGVIELMTDDDEDDEDEDEDEDDSSVEKSDSETNPPVLDPPLITAPLDELKKAVIDSLSKQWLLPWDHPDGRNLLPTNDRFDLHDLELVLQEGDFISYADKILEGVKLLSSKDNKDENMAAKSLSCARGLSGLVGLICKMSEQAGVEKERKRDLIDKSTMLSAHETVRSLLNHALSTVPSEPPFMKYPVRIEHTDWMSQSVRMRNIPQPFSVETEGVGEYRNEYCNQLPVIAFHSVHQRNYGCNPASQLVPNIADFFKTEMNAWRQSIAINNGNSEI